MVQAYKMLPLYHSHCLFKFFSSDFSRNYETSEKFEGFDDGGKEYPKKLKTKLREELPVKSKLQLHDP